MHIFREAKEHDYEGICKLIKSKEELFLVYPYGKYPLTIEQVKELSQVRKALTVIVKDGKIIGFANFYNHKPNESAFIGNVIIEERYRGKGLGKKLIIHMLEKATNIFNLSQVNISVFSDNTPAISLYKSFGFIPYKKEERENINHEKVQLIHMKKCLSKNHELYSTFIENKHLTKRKNT